MFISFNSFGTYLFRVFNIFFDMRGMVMVFNATFNIISVISWRSVPGENHRPAQVTDKLYHILLHRVHLTMSVIRTHN